jgi:hypothetical protein
MAQNDDITAVRAAKDAAGRVHAGEQSLRVKHKALVTERRKIIQAARCLEEVLVNAARLVDEAGAKFIDRFAQRMVRELSGYTEQRGSGDERREVAARAHLPILPDGFFDFGGLCGMVPALMKERLADVIRRSGANFGLPTEARAAKVAELDAGIAALEALHTELVDGAGEVGIALPLLDTVAKRREDEARTLAREQELAAQRAAGIYAVTL